ncbi:dTMP kinase [Candidatus Woesearchaeota archaeon]|nr:dTMP kinase [Candidatus Woesearchaeota archaeon]
MKGKFVTFEGGEGSGKGTIIRLLKEHFKKKKVSSVFTEEPGGTREGLAIRKVLLNKKHHFDALTDVLLFIAARRKNTNNIILPALKKGLWVVCDRYYDSTYVYEGFAGHIKLELIKKLHELARIKIKPDVTFYLDVLPEVGLARATKRNKVAKSMELRFDEKGLKFHNKVRKGYLTMAKKEPSRYVVVDTENNTIEQVFTIILQELNKRFSFPL